ncbi:cytochrome P450 4p1-like isoform X1 [Drosophila kikkawai]|uniref:Cytochrome P450 4p1-like isoform X1 n=1 Tax=Drosophila kikkawai TaxID=30033 RepID=A0A6P4IF89_DROKI|nr:cytochrome P450 4p1-like [Drosophila kikkawai]
MFFLILVVAGSLLLHWLYKLNKDYYVMAFFAKRLYTKDGRSAESISPVAPGKTIFGNTLDLYGCDNASVFKLSRDLAKEMGESFVEYDLGTPVYNVIDAEIAENVMNHPNLITKGLFYKFLYPFLRTGLLTSTGKKWHSRRKMLTPTFHFNILNQFQEIFKTESQKFLQQFRGKDEATIVLNDVIPRFTLNSICETAMGVKLDEMAEKGDRYRESFSQIEACFTRRLSNPFLWGDWLFNLLAAKDYAAALNVVHGFSSEIIAKRRLLLKDELENLKEAQSNDDDVFTTKKRFAMLDTLIYAEKDGLIDHIGICEEVDTLMFEGYDTTSIGLIFGLMNMGLYADKQEECYQEIQEHISDDLSNLDIGQLNKLKYLDYFMKETVRLLPSVPVMGREAVQDTELANGLVLPKGSQIALNVFDIHRNVKYWDSPDEFRPERFLPENCQNRHTYAYVPFSAGQRNCIGQKYAMQEMKTLLVVILKEFKILPVTDPKTIIFTAGITLRTQNKIQVKLVRRK